MRKTSKQENVKLIGIHLIMYITFCIKLLLFLLKTQFYVQLSISLAHLSLNESDKNKAVLVIVTMFFENFQ